MKKRWAWITLTALVVAALFSGGCDYLEKKRILRLLEQREAGLLKGLPGVYLNFFSPSYREEWLDFEKCRIKAAERLKRRPLPQIAFTKREIEINGDKAVVTEWFTFDDKVEGRKRHYQEVQHLVLARDAQGWKCISGSKVLALLGGRLEEEHEIERTMLRRESALVKEDINAFMGLISPRYNHKGETKEDVREKMLQIFRVYDDINFRSYDRRIYFFGTVATVEQKFSMSAVMMGKPRNFSGEERFELEKTEEGWKFIKGFN